MKSKTRQIDGEFWFTAIYAATLLGTTKKKIEAMIVRDLIRAREDGNAWLVAEADVTRLRRDSDALSALKEAARMPAYPPKGGSMPADTIYVGDTPPQTLRARPRIGHPLKDEGRS
jgi:hypothetical protein